MAEIILHVGMDKTGSSSIQHSLDGYDDGSMHYARLASANHSAPLTILFGVSKQPSRALKAQGLGAAELLAQRERHRSDLHAALNTGHDRVILSAEGILSLGKSALVQLRDFLLERADRIRVIAYIRDPIGFSSSAFQQATKAGEGRWRIPTPRYSARLGQVESVFGRSAMTYIRFDPSSFPDRSVVQDFATRIGADPARITEQRSNESLPLYLTAALYLFNRARRNLTGSPALFRARLRMVRMLLHQTRQQSGPRAALIEERRRRTAPGAPPRTAKFQLAAHVIRDALDPRDLGWMEERVDSALLPLRNIPEEPGEFDIVSENQLIDIAEASAQYLQPTLRRYKLAPRNRSTLAAMDAIFELAAARRS